MDDRAKAADPQHGMTFTLDVGANRSSRTPRQGWNDCQSWPSIARISKSRVVN